MKTRNLIAALLMASVLGGMSGGVARAAGDKVVTAGKPAKLALGELAPEIEAVGMDGKAVTLKSLVGKPVVLQFGSLTEPIFRMRAADSEKMAETYGDKVAFVVVYAREAHAADGETALEANVDAGFAITKPVNEAERVKLATQAVERLKIAKETVVVDGWSDTSSLRYGNYPNMTFVIDDKGKLQAGFAWMEPAKVKGALDAILAGKPVAAEFRGQTQAGTPGQLDYSSSMEMDGYRGGALALTLDKMAMTDKQKSVIYPALGEYLAEARDVREQLGNNPNGQGKRPAAPVVAAGGAKPAGGDAMVPDADKKDGTAPATAKPSTVLAKSPEEIQAAVEKMRAAAQKLKAACKENLSEKDSKAILDLLEQGPAKRMFAD